MPPRAEVPPQAELERQAGIGSIPRGTELATPVGNGAMTIFLPQVATDYGWDRTTFLEHTCQKAGLPKDAWQDKATEIYTFSADVF